MTQQKPLEQSKQTTPAKNGDPGNSGQPAESNLIVTVDSRKGGVGKTTLALFIAMEFLEKPSSSQQNESDKPVVPVVFIDADILGTDISDALCPWIPGDRDWDFGLLDILTQSTGGLETCRENYKRKLESIGKCFQKRQYGQTGLPCPLLTGSVPLLIIPSHSSRDPGQRSQAGLNELFAAESFGRRQMELRLTTLLDVIIETLAPRCIIIDNAPFQMPLSQVWKQWEKDDDFRKILPSSVSRDRWKRYQIRKLDVVGPEEQDLILRTGEWWDPHTREWSDLSKPEFKNHRWALNKDCHFSSGNTQKCGWEKLCPQFNSPYQPASIGHVPINPVLLLGTHNRLVMTIDMNFAKDQFVIPEDRLTTPFAELIASPEKCKKRCTPLIFDKGRKAYFEKDWRPFLLGEPGAGDAS